MEFHGRDRQVSDNNTYGESYPPIAKALVWGRYLQWILKTDLRSSDPSSGFDDTGKQFKLNHTRNTRESIRESTEAHSSLAQNNPLTYSSPTYDYDSRVYRGERELTSSLERENIQPGGRRVPRDEPRETGRPRGREKLIIITFVRIVSRDVYLCIYVP